jgi:uncharacterized protein (DUF1800 family)
VPATDLLDERDAAHLLRRAGFGSSPRERARFVGLSRAEAVEALLAAKPSAARGPAASVSTTPGLRRLQSWWLRRMLSPRYRLQEKMALFWHDHFPSEAGIIGDLGALAEQNALFRLHGLGSFRTLVHLVTRNRAMLDYLDGVRSRVDEVNENYARELMELFTLGPWDEDGFENYTQEDVVELARALTGFAWDRTLKKPAVYLDPARFDAGPKRLFAARPFEVSGVLGVEHEDGTPFPPATNVLDALFAHRDTQGRPTLARFLVRKLWAWFATPEAGDALVDELSGVFVASDYQIDALLRAMLGHDAFYAEEARHATAKNPVEFATQALLALDVKGNMKELAHRVTRMGMDLFAPPGVEGWQHGPAWLATSRYLARIEFAHLIASGHGSSGFKRKLRLPSGATPGSLVDAALGQLDLEVSEATRERLIDYVAEGGFGGESWLQTRYPGLFVLLLGLPEFQVH